MSRPSEDTRDDSPLEPLPETLDVGMRALRRVNPPTATLDRMEAALAAADENRARPDARNVPTRRRPFPALLAVVPTLTLAALAVLLVARGSDVPMEEIGVTEDLALTLPAEGRAFLDVALRTEHHDDATTKVTLDAPERLQVTMAGISDATGGPNCADARCVHRFEVDRDEGPLRIGVDEPGHYVIHVRHESSEANVHQRFTLRVTR